MPLYSTEPWREKFAAFLQRKRKANWTLVTWSEQLKTTQLRHGGFLILSVPDLSRWLNDTKSKSKYRGPTAREDYVDIADALIQLGVITREEARVWFYVQGLNPIPNSDEVIVFGIAKPFNDTTELAGTELDVRADLTPPEFDLVGRTSEWDQMQTAWNAAKAGRAQLLLFTSDPGCGKTHLSKELYFWLAERGHITAWANCGEFDKKLAYVPILDWLRQREAFQAALHLLEDDIATEIGYLLSGARFGASGKYDHASGERRLRLFKAFADIFTSSERPVLLVIDDLQWCDQDTLEWLNFVLRHRPTARLLIVCALRSGAVDNSHLLKSIFGDLRQTSKLIEVDLLRMSRNETADLVTEITGIELSEEQLERLDQFAEGNPLIITELARSAAFAVFIDTTVEAADRLPSQLRVPRLDVYVDRLLDQQDPLSRDIAVWASILGRSFTFPSLAQACRIDRDELIESLDKLCQTGFIRPLNRQAYEFRYDSYREGAYKRMSPAKAAVRHLRVAEILAKSPSAALDEAVIKIAYHYEQAGDLERAIAYYQQAAGIERGRKALIQATAYINKCLELLSGVPPSQQQQIQVDLLLELGSLLAITKGHASRDVMIQYEKAFQVGQSRGQLDPTALWGLGMSLSIQGRLREAKEKFEKCLEIADYTDHPELKLEAHAMLGFIFFFLGDFRSSDSHIIEGTNLYEAIGRRDLAARYIQDPGVLCKSLRVMVDWFLGRHSQYQARLEAAKELIEEIQERQPFDLCVFLVFKAWWHMLRGEWVEAKEDSVNLLENANRYGFNMWQAVGRAWLSMCKSHFEHTAEMVSELLGRCDEYLAIGAKVNLTFVFAWIADFCLQFGEIEQGRTAVALGLQFLAENDEGFCEAELIRLQGEYAYAEGDLQKAKGHLLVSVAVAKRQEALSLQLRTFMSLCRLFSTDEEISKWQQELRDTYEQIDEGRGTVDAQEAGRLLGLG